MTTGRIPVVDISDAAFWEDIRAARRCGRWWQKVMFNKNPPEQTRLRSLLGRAFTPVSLGLE